MMPTIGSVTCTFVHGSIPSALSKRVEVWQTPGVDGYGVQLHGQGDGDFELRAVYRGSSAADVAAWHGNLLGLKGTLVTVSNDVGVSCSALIVKVGPCEIGAALDYHHNTTHRGEAAVQCIRTA